MSVKRTVVVGLIGVIVLCGGTTALLAHPWTGGGDIVARGQERPHTPSHVSAAASHALSHVSVSPAHISSASSHALSQAPSAAHRQSQALSATKARATHHQAAPIAAHRRLRHPAAPAGLRQIGGIEPANRLLPPGSWVNTPDITLSMRMTSPMSSAHLRPQVEVRPVGQPFTGRPTATGAVRAFKGTSVVGSVAISGLRNGMSYHWRARVYDTRGAASHWVEIPHNVLRVHLGAPVAPAVSLVTAAQPGNWVRTRQITLHWAETPDPSGIRGYSYTLTRSAASQPPMRPDTGLSSVTVHANGTGAWYFSVRALNNAHTWGPVTRIPIHIVTAVPRLQTIAAPAPTQVINPRRTPALLRLGLTETSWVTVDVLTSRGRPVRTILTSLHPAGYDLRITWDGRDDRGQVVPNGAYQLRLTAVNRAGGRWTTTRPLQVMTGPPRFTAYGLSQTYSYNPYNNSIDGPENITATLDGPADVRIDALHGSTVERSWTFSGVHAGDVITATWDGQAANGADLPSGAYTFRATATDPDGDKQTTTLGTVTLDLRRIVVSLKQQKLWALDGNKVLLSTLVTTGGPELPTPTGDYQIIDRESPFTFHSPFPPGSPYWYPDSPTNFALLFQSDGYFIHDAPWRSYYGPGSNVVDGTPGQNTTGTHGCVNVPYQPMSWLYTWATMYTPVQVRDDVSLS